jgi:hypothetical protein
MISNNLYQGENKMVLHADRVSKRHAKVIAGNNPFHKHYHPNTKNPEKRTVKPSFNIHVSATCKKCGKVFHRAIDSVEHFDAILAKNGWKHVGFTKSEENQNSSAKDIHGICCPGCRNDIKVWEEENHPKKKASAPKHIIDTIIEEKAKAMGLEVDDVTPHN